MVTRARQPPRDRLLHTDNSSADEIDARPAPRSSGTRGRTADPARMEPRADPAVEQEARQARCSPSRRDPRRGDLGCGFAVAAAGAVTWFPSIVSGLGVGPALVQRDELEPRHISTGLTSPLGLGVLIAVLTYTFAPQIANLFRTGGRVSVLRGMALAFPITALSVVGECLLQRDMKLASISGIELAADAVGYGVVGIVLAWLGFGVWALVAAEVTKAIFKTGLFCQGDNLVTARFLGPASLGRYRAGPTS